MAFSTQFVIGTGGGGGGGGSVETIPVGPLTFRGSDVIVPITSVNAGAGAYIVLTGHLIPSSNTVSARPHLEMGGAVYTVPNETLTGAGSPGIGGFFTGDVNVQLKSRHTSADSTFTGTLHIVRV